MHASSSQARRRSSLWQRSALTYMTQPRAWCEPIPGAMCGTAGSKGEETSPGQRAAFANMHRRCHSLHSALSLRCASPGWHSSRRPHWPSRVQPRRPYHKKRRRGMYGRKERPIAKALWPVDCAASCPHTHTLSFSVYPPSMSRMTPFGRGAAVTRHAASSTLHSTEKQRAILTDGKQWSTAHLTAGALDAQSKSNNERKKGKRQQSVRSRCL